MPPRADWPYIAISGVLQMASYSTLAAIALTVLPAGRASVLAFSTPIWVVPIAAWWLGESPSHGTFIGTCLGLLGVRTIAAPSFHAEGRQVVASGLFLGAALSWATAIVAVRAHRFQATALALAPWQMVVAAGLPLPLALVVEGAPPPLTPRGAASLAFVGPVATAFAYWAVVEAGRRLRAVVLSTGLLASPALGTLISALGWGEEVDLWLITGMVLIATGIGLVTFSSEKNSVGDGTPLRGLVPSDRE